MSSWKECKLGEVLELKYGKDHKALNDGNIPVYGSGGIMRYADSFLYDKESILIPRKGTLNNIFYIDGVKPFWTVDTIFWSKINTEKVFGKFLFYYLKIIDFANLNVGSAVPSLTTKVLNEIEISIPPLEEQKAIAEVLSSLDDKIDLLHRQNKTLEELAQTLFRQWFIEEAKDEWEITTLGTLGRAVTGKTPSTKNTEFWGEEIYFITPTDFKHYGKYTTFADRSLSLLGMGKVKSSVLPKNSILVTCIGSDMGKVAIAQSQCVSNQQINSLIIKDSLLVEYVYQHLKYIYPLLRAIAMGGTTMPIINKTDFENIEITLPTYDLIEKFHEITSFFNEKIIQNTNQIKTLENMRDTLLPKLMSGEVRVNY
ncbi:restriction endonuclease subunit S [bacterium]|nr:restriction endonuclease subunit S [bacterium]MBU1995313.1 restriction endonuclease subunit S [bacterium]